MGLKVSIVQADEASDVATFTASDDGEHTLGVKGECSWIALSSVEAQKFARSIDSAVRMVDGNGSRGYDF